MHYPLVHHQYRADWPIAFRSKRLYHISEITISLLRHVLRADIQGNMNKHHKNSKINSFETWHLKRHKLGYSRIVVVMFVNIFMLLLFLPFSYSQMQFPSSILKLSTQHPLYFFKLSTQHQPAITSIENWAILPTQGLQFSYTLIRAFSKISAYTKTAQFYSTKNTSTNKFLAQSSVPCLMLGGIPPASLSEGW